MPENASCFSKASWSRRRSSCPSSQTGVASSRRPPLDGEKIPRVLRVGRCLLPHARARRRLLRRDKLITNAPFVYSKRYGRFSRRQLRHRQCTVIGGPVRVARPAGRSGQEKQLFSPSARLLRCVEPDYTRTNLYSHFAEMTNTEMVAISSGAKLWLLLQSLDVPIHTNLGASLVYSMSSS